MNKPAITIRFESPEEAVIYLDALYNRCAPWFDAMYPDLAPMDRKAVRSAAARAACRVIAADNKVGA